MLITLAASNATATAITSHRGNFFRSAAMSPEPVTMPMRAHSSCTATISGQVSMAVQSMLVPSCAPAME
jgi:hypothetical protein